MARGHEYLRRIFNTDNGIIGGVQHQQGAFQIMDGRGQVLGVHVMHKIAANADRTPAKVYLGLTFGFDLIQSVAEIMGDMGRIKRCSNGGDGLDGRHLTGGAQHGCTPKGMPDQQARCHVAAFQIFSGGQQITDIRGKAGIGKLAVTMTKPGKIKPQHRDPHGRQSPGNAARGGDVFGTGEAMGKQGRAQQRTVGQIKPRRQLIAALSGESNSFS